jgi:hypothetical protein
MPVTLKELLEKFIQKGMLYEFHVLVLIPGVWAPGREVLFNTSAKEQAKIRQEAIQKVYSAEWEYWNTWIDYQQHKF